MRYYDDPSPVASAPQRVALELLQVYAQQYIPERLLNQRVEAVSRVLESEGRALVLTMSGYLAADHLLEDTQALPFHKMIDVEVEVDVPLPAPWWAPWRRRTVAEARTVRTLVSGEVYAQARYFAAFPEITRHYPAELGPAQRRIEVTVQ